ncbi:MAG: hypothetical protein Kow0067_12490 [Coriobacteriia bacterium]|nr:hypothetical protein [Anaerosomatales bacterium]
MTGEEHPDRWGQDSLSSLLEVARGHELAAFQGQSRLFNLLAKVDAVFDAASGSLPHSPNWFPGLLLLSSHRAFRGGAHLALSGFAPESYACARLVLEYSLSGVHLSRNPETAVTWLSRHDGEAARRTVRNEFSYRGLLQELTDLDADKADKVSRLYELTIDRGAHPNEQALTGVLEIEEQPGQKSFKVAHLCGDGLALPHAMATLARCGVHGLDVFSLVFPERFSLTGVNATLASLKSSL